MTRGGAQGPGGTSRRRGAYRLGLRAETLAALYLRAKGWRILARRFRAGSGEIDIIARRGRTIAFIEVKARGNRDAALTAITPSAQRRIASAARTWCAGREDLGAMTLRFDAVLVSPWRLPVHIADAFAVAER